MPLPALAAGATEMPSGMQLQALRKGGIAYRCCPGRAWSRRIKDIIMKNKRYQKALNGSPGGHACSAAPILGDLFDRFAGRQPQTWDCLGLHLQFYEFVWPMALQPASPTPRSRFLAVSFAALWHTHATISDQVPWVPK